MASPPSAAQALEVNRAYAAELQSLLATLSQQEQQLKDEIQALERRRAMQRAKSAMNALLLGRQSPSSGAAALDATVFEPSRESKYKKTKSEALRSYIRQQPSFFRDSDAEVDDDDDDDDDSSRPKNKRRRIAKPNAHSEPRPNADTMELHVHANESFVAVPAKCFSAKERSIVKAFAQNLLHSGKHTEPIPLQAWNEITKQKPIIHRSAFACKLRWELHDRPGLRLCAWTKQEDEALRALASGQVDASLVNQWDEIAARMPMPGRPPVHCLIRYQSKLCATNLNTSFTTEEDAMIHEAVDVFGERWNIIADLMDGHVPEQIRHRWQYCLAPNLRQGKFSVIEDRRLLLALYIYHDKTTPFQKETVAWNAVGHHVPGRTLPQLRDRFLNSLNSEVVFGSWSKEDDAKLLAAVQEIGLSVTGIWARIAAELGNRSDNQVLRRWKYLAPLEYARHQKQKKVNMTLPQIFQRSLRTVNLVKTKRSSYNAEEGEPENPDTDFVAMLV